MRIKIAKIFATLILVSFMLAPFSAMAAKFTYSAWLPFWKKQEGAQDFALHMEKFNSISPFSYEVNADGTLKDSFNITSGFVPGWLGAIKDGNVKIIPTVALLNGSAIHKLLSNTKLRQKHEDIIAALVKSQKFDGIDIDYEDKRAADGAYFSTFLKGLAMRLHPMKKTLVCTIEGRTPLTSMFDVVPADHAYANDYKAINTYCDEVRIMAYDQGNIDLRMNAQKGNGQYYMPVADKDWVEKVIKETIKTIKPSKVVLGIPTYGYVYEVSQATDSKEITYKRLRSVTYEQGSALAQSVGATTSRNNAGELSFTYATSTPVDISKNLTYKIQANLLLSLPSTISSSTPVARYVTFSDATAAADKIALAKKYKLGGAVVFKMDGDADPVLWASLK